ncbi:MAG TPA: DUF1080 domain-containing protein [Gemmataceae bacterium]|nr:DUF1080 domain-containing protein [Gemmataceae bacterium]
MTLSRIAAFCAALALPMVVSAEPPAGWKSKHPDKGKWVVGTAAVDDKDPKKLTVKDGGTDVVNVQPASDLISEAKYGDCMIELEFLIPKGSNSGVYVMGEYEVQILDSYGKPADKLTQGDLGALYSAAAPKVNASKKPGEWQKFVIEFQAPKFDGTKKVANARFVKVTLNGVVLHENVEMKGVTPGGLTGKEAATGPLMFQGDHGQVALRNIKVTSR